MKRPWQIGLTVLFCLAVVFGGMGWITARLLRLEAHNRSMQRQAAEESVIRLALWRMDAAVSPLIIAESARPYYEYSAFNPAQTVYPIAVSRDDVNATLVPSPLLTQSSSNILVYFNGAVIENGKPTRLESPQVPVGELNNWVLDNYGATGFVAANTINFDTFTSNVTISQLREAFGETNAVTESTAQVTANQWDVPQVYSINAPAQLEQSVPDPQQAEVQQLAMSANEQFVRQQQTLRSQQRIQSGKQQVYDQNVQFYNTKVAPQQKPIARQPPSLTEAPSPWNSPAQRVEEGIMRAAWVDDMLVLGRTVVIDGTRFVQGAWINWDALREELLAEIKDILPLAQLVSVRIGENVNRAHVMANLPVRLVPGPCATLPALSASPLHAPLITAWVCVLLATAAVCLLVAGTVSLSERRAAFVSAVTHELRTPLTTFQMYSEMLAEGMVPEERQAEYFEVLRAEGTRLSHLVENILSYSRLEKGKRPNALRVVSVNETVHRIRDRLERRAAQADMCLVCDGITTDANVRADAAMIEQILFNLVDNACKYAVQSEDKRIHLQLAIVKSNAVLSIRDHGPGISPNEASRLFRPFHKSAKHAADTAPGVGLGLALSRKLARRMGGSLRINSSLSHGACFELVLPLVRL